MRNYCVPFFFKFSLVFIFCTSICTFSFAQFNYYKFSAGLGSGFTLPFADTKKANYSFASQVTLDYYFTPYINTGLEIQAGNMRGGAQGQGNFTNSFKLITWTSRMQLGQFYDRYDRLNTLTSLIRGLYFGMGIGIIRNDAEAYRVDPTSPDGILAISGVNHDLIFPINTGANVYLKDFYGRDRWEINFNFQFVTAMEDGMDGDLNPSSNYNDVYNYLSIGFRYKFGVVGLDKRKNRLH